MEFTIFHLNEVNYLQVRASSFRQLAQKLAFQIPNAPSFPAHLGLIGIPYSQSSAVFLNSLIPHEMGHFVYQHLDKANALFPKVDAALSAALGATIPTSHDRRWCLDKLSRWVEEVFCDLFAVWMVGPAYPFAYVELLDLANIPSVAALPSAPKEHLGFHPSHPADACRLTQHVKFLRKLGWWSHITRFKTNYIHVLRHAEGIAQTEYTFPSDRPLLSDPTKTAFFRLLPFIMDEVRSVVRGLDVGVAGYARHQSAVEDYLHSGVVPSTVSVSKVKSRGRKTDFENPDPITVLNVAYKIHLESVEFLLKQVGETPRSVRARSEWTTRLELWAAKAFEDHSLLSRGA